MVQLTLLEQFLTFLLLKFLVNKMLRILHPFLLNTKVLRFLLKLQRFLLWENRWLMLYSIRIYMGLGSVQRHLLRNIFKIILKFLSISIIKIIIILYLLSTVGRLLLNICILKCIFLKSIFHLILNKWTRIKLPLRSLTLFN